MAINRFSRGPIAADVQSDFIPLPVDVIDRQIQRRQSQYDLAKQTIDASQEAAYGVKGLSPDQQSIKDITSAYDEDITSAIEKAGGDYSRLTTYSDLLAKKVNTDIKTGHLGAIQNNFIKAQNHMGTVSEELQKGNISQEGYDRAMASISGFGGTVEDGKGGYTRASFYQPTKYLEMGKTADEYGKVIRDQYNARGEKYIDAKTAGGFIYQNLYNNPQARANAEEQVVAIYGEAQPELTRKRVSAYLRKVAQDAGNKLEFKETFKATGEANPLTGGSLITFDKFSAKPNFAQFRVKGETLENALDRIDRQKAMGALSKQVQRTGASISAVGSLTAGMSPSIVAQKELPDVYEQTQNDYDKLVKGLYADIDRDHFTKDVAFSLGIDLDDESQRTRENLDKINEFSKVVNSQVPNTRVTLSLDEDVEENFDRRISNPMAWEGMDIMNLSTGEWVKGDNKSELLLSHLNSKDDDKSPDRLMLGGRVMDDQVDQYYPPGSELFKSAGGEDSYAIIPRNVRNANFRANKVNVAKTGGTSTWVDGGNSHRLFYDPATRNMTYYKNDVRTPLTELSKQ